MCVFPFAGPGTRTPTTAVSTWYTGALTTSATPTPQIFLFILLRTMHFEVSDACDLSGLVAGRTLVDSLVFGESTRDSERVYAERRLHLEVLGWLDDRVVVVPLHHRV